MTMGGLEHERSATQASTRGRTSGNADSLIGRDALLVKVIDAVRVERWVTLTGLGGMGKTTLAQHAAQQLSSEFAQGVQVIQPPGSDDADAWLQALARQLGLRLRTGAPASVQLAEHLAGDHMLLLLDDVNTSLIANAGLAALMQQAPLVHVLATARAPLRIAGECVVAVTGLSTSAKGNALSEAEALFVHYAGLARGAFQRDDSNRADIRRICEMADGMPLAIELAAAWVSLLPCSTIAQQIKLNLDWLSTSIGITHRQQRSVRAVFDSFWTMLPAHVRESAEALTVFCNGFDSGMAEVVAGAGIADLNDLVQYGFLKQDATGRYRFHDLLHQYTAERLHANPAREDECRRRHACAFLAFSNKLYHNLAQTRLLMQASVEMDNLRAAQTWLLQAQPDDGRQMVMWLSHFWYEIGAHAEGRRWCQHALAISPRDDALAVAIVSDLATFAILQGNPVEARALHQRAEHGVAGMADVTLQVKVLRDRVFIEMFIGNLQVAIPLQQQIIALHDTLNDDYEAGTDWHNLGCMYLEQGQYADAAGCLRRSMALSRSFGDEVGVAYSTGWLTFASLAMQQCRQIAPELLAALDVFRHFEDMPALLLCIDAASAVLLACASDTALHVAASRLMGFTKRQGESIQLVRSQHMRSLGIGLEQQLIARLGVAAYMQAVDAGALLARQDALDLACQSLAALSSTST